MNPLIDVARFVSVGRTRLAMPSSAFRDEKVRLVASGLPPRQFRTLANGVLGLAEAAE